MLFMLSNQSLTYMTGGRKTQPQRDGSDDYDGCDIMVLFAGISRRSDSVLTKRKKKKKAIIQKGEMLHRDAALISAKDSRQVEVSQDGNNSPHRWRQPGVSRNGQGNLVSSALAQTDTIQLILFCSLKSWIESAVKWKVWFSWIYGHIMQPHEPYLAVNVECCVPIEKPSLLDWEPIFLQ